MSYSEYLEFAKEIAEKAGKLILDHREKGIHAKKKQEDNSIVTNADFASEAFLKNEIKKKYPEHNILGEETGGEKHESEFTWIIDPIDGTRNYSNNIPIFCVAIGLVQNGKTIVGAAYNPITKEMFYATLGGGAFLNGERIKCSEVSDLKESVMTFGLPRDPVLLEDRKKDIIKLLPPTVKRLRAHGCAIMMQCYVAAGRTDCYVHAADHPWDKAAGGIIVAEAGGNVTQYDGSEYNVFENGTLSSNGLVHEQILEVLKS